MVHAEYLDLIKIVNEHNKRYYIESNPIISDHEYDELINKLKEFEKENPSLIDSNSPIKILSIQTNSIFEKIKHDHPMLSLDNTYNMEDVKNFDKRINKYYKNDNNIKKYCVELKIDGVSISIKYKNKKLYKAITRGDGIIGEDITHNVKHIPNIPKVLDDSILKNKLPDIFEVRGEIFLTFENYNEINKDRKNNNEQLYSNPRNLSSGILRRKEPNKKQLELLSYFVYDIPYETYNTTSQSDSLNILKELKFSVQPNFECIDSIDNLKSIIDNWENKKEDLNFPIDGLVIKINNNTYRNVIGNTSHHPNWAVAYKFKATKKYTKLKDVTLQVGKTGIITPVAELEPIEIDGTIVKRASLHNYDIIKNLGIMIGDYVEVQKAAEIIPQVIGFDVNKRNKDEVKKITLPKKCPCCGGEVGKNKNSNVYICCLNEKCPAKIKGMISYWVSKKCMDIEGLGETIIDKLVDKKLVKNIVDLYKLDKDDLLKIDRMGDKLADNILKSIEKSKDQPFERVLCGLGIPNVGRTISKILCNKFGDLRKVIDATFNELIGIEDIGPTVATEIIEYFKKDENIDMLNSLDTLGLKFEVDKKEVKEMNEEDNTLNGMNICITGTLSIPRNEFRNIILVNGGEISSSITNKTTHLVYGTDCGSKLQKAKDKNITLLTESEFFDLIRK